jgi:hypothetical protein
LVHRAGAERCRALLQGSDARVAGPVIGDSEIMETMGLGAFAMAGAPGLARYIGGTVSLGARITDEMYAITIAEHPELRMPHLDARGAPLGIDVRKVLSTGIAPAFNTGIAHVEPGIGQIGAGYGRVPIECFEAATEQLHARHPVPDLRPDVGQCPDAHE